jgi:hypothetical protein
LHDVLAKITNNGKKSKTIESESESDSETEYEDVDESEDEDYDDEQQEEDEDVLEFTTCGNNYFETHLQNESEISGKVGLIKSIAIGLNIHYRVCHGFRLTKQNNYF